MSFTLWMPSDTKKIEITNKQDPILVEFIQKAASHKAYTHYWINWHFNINHWKDIHKQYECHSVQLYTKGELKLEYSPSTHSLVALPHSWCQVYCICSHQSWVIVPFCKSVCSYLATLAHHSVSATFTDPSQFYTRLEEATEKTKAEKTFTHKTVWVDLHRPKTVCSNYWKTKELCIGKVWISAGAD